MSVTNIDEYTWFQPLYKSKMAITIPNKESVNLNSNLVEQLPAYIEIGVSSAGDQICIREKPTEGYKLLKSGRITDVRLMSFILKTKVSLPARYTVLKKDDCWIATLEKPLILPINPNKMPKKAPKRDLSRLLEEAEAL